MSRTRIASLAGAALFWACTGLMLSASSCVVPEPIPGQPMTAEQAAYAKMIADQEAHERRRQERPCRPGDCMN